MSAACLLNGADLRPSRKAGARSETQKKLMCLADRCSSGHFQQLNSSNLSAGSADRDAPIF